MSKILRRPMFRGGGSVNSRGTGITSGLDTPKRGMVDGPGSYIGKKVAGAVGEDVAGVLAEGIPLVGELAGLGMLIHGIVNPTPVPHINMYMHSSNERGLSTGM